MTSSGYFLNVETSALGRPWRPRLDGAGEARALAIAQVGGQDELIARVFAGRGVEPEAVERYLDPTLRDLMPDPYRMRDMEAATKRLKHAVERAERVAIFGDYDVDGACSAALMSESLRRAAARRSCRSPIEFPRAMARTPKRSRASRKGASLVVTVDCGAVSHEPFAEACRLGLDVIVFDHHQVAEEPAGDARRWLIPTGRTIFPASDISRPPGSFTWPSSRSIARCAKRALERASSS